MRGFVNCRKTGTVALCCVVHVAAILLQPTENSSLLT